MDEELRRPTTYFVNGEKEQTHQERLKVKVILENAGFPPDKYKLKRIEPKPRYEFDDYDEEVDITENEEFEAKHKGPTPTS
jgi:hypothetical protein